MAKELAHFKNFAKLKDTKVAFNDITVIAGKPGTGKSYVMKFMYAIDEAYTKLFNEINILENKEKIIKKRIDEFKDIAENIDSLSKKEKEKILEDIFQVRKNFLKVQNKKKDISSSVADEKINEALLYTNILKSIFISLDEISKNFWVEYLGIIIKVEEKELIISDSNMNRQVETSKIFVETPLILEFKKFMKREEGKTPYHIESLLNILDTDYSFVDEEQDKFIKDFTQKSKEIIKGDIESSGDSFIFNKEGDKNYDIVNTSSGTKSIGLLQYLVTNKALKKGSVLYWEEPEVHLHPSWQLKMVDLFVELMNAGVKIVFSTHSPYMADYLNAISKKNNYRDRISFNVLDEKDEVVTNHILDDDNWDILQKELMDTFEDILWQYL